MSKPDSDADDCEVHIHEDAQTLVGHGEVSYHVEYEQERVLQSVVSNICLKTNRAIR